VSSDPFGRSADLARLVEDGFELELTGGGHLIVRHIPYRTAESTVSIGAIVTKLEFDGDVTVNPVGDHTIRFIGGAPHRAVGPLHPVIGSTDEEIEPGLVVNHHLSLKPEQPYSDYYDKVVAYVGLITPEAQALDPSVDARTFGPCVADDADWPFEYVDTASGRAGIGATVAPLRDQRVAIVGVGGTGSYILDLVAKSPVREIHLYDGDRFSTHNAFRAPGAATIDELRRGEHKVTYLQAKYSAMKRNVTAHPCHIDSSNVGELEQMSFVFLAMEGPAKREIVAALEGFGVSFVDCSIGVTKPDGDPRLMANLEVNASTPDNRTTLREKVDFGDIDDDDPYADNIQIAELNLLNAGLAVLWWKKHSAVYRHRELDHHQHLNVHFGRLHSE